MDNFFAAKRYFPLFMRDVGRLGAVDNSVDNFETILWITLWKTFAGDHPHVLFFLFSDFGNAEMQKCSYRISKPSMTPSIIN